jgi:hypothetical protein
VPSLPLVCSASSALAYEHYGQTPPDWVTYGRGYVYPPTALLAIPTFLPVDVCPSFTPPSSCGEAHWEYLTMTRVRV